MVNIISAWSVGKSIGIAAPYYNLALVIIVILLFVKLFKTQTQIYLRPWKLLCIAVLVFVLEEIVVILGVLTEATHFVVGFFEMIIILLFMYMVLLQKDYVKKSVK